MLLEDRLAQIVPTLTPAQIEFALRFASGPAKHFVRDEKLLDVGDRNTAVWLVVEGSIIASRRDGLGRERVFATGGPGQFSGEVSDLAGHASLAVVCAEHPEIVAKKLDYKLKDIVVDDRLYAGAVHDLLNVIHSSATSWSA